MSYLISFLFTLDSRHSIAISQMGNYQDYLKQTNPLRELDPGMNRAHMFGNPFKLAKDQVCTLIMFLKLSVTTGRIFVTPYM